MREQLETHGRYSYRFVELTEPDLPGALFAEEEHACLITIQDTEVADSLKEPISRALVASGCRWVSCHGPGCADWEETIDWANVDAVVGPPAHPDLTVTTTSHPDQPLGDVANMLAFSHTEQGERFAHILVLGLGGSSEAFRIVSQAFAQARREGAA